MGRRDLAKASTATGPRAPTTEEAASIDRARSRNKARGSRIALQRDLKAETQDNFVLSAPHADAAGWSEQLQDAFGTTSEAFATSEIGRLLQMAGAGRTEGPHPIVVNGLMAAVSGIQPRDEVEAMLAVQMAATHDLAMNVLAKAKGGTMLQQTEALTTVAVKLMRTYTTQIEALAKLRRGGEQTVRVEHVHVYPGGQAIVGQVSTSIGGGGQLENGQQSHAPLDPRSLVFAPVDPVLRHDEGRDRMPVSRCQGEGPVPDARRRQGGRGS